MFRNHILRALDRNSQAMLIPRLRETSLVSEQVVVEEGAKPSWVWFPETVVFSSRLIMRDGRVAEISSVGREGAAGLLACMSGVPSVPRITVHIAGSALGIRASDLRTLALTDPALDCVLLRAAQVALDHSEQSIACNAFHGATQRLARRLLETRDRSASERFPFTQEAMAVALGVQRTTANAAAQQLKALGAILYSRGQVRITDSGRLEALACDCYRPITSPASNSASYLEVRQHVA